MGVGKGDFPFDPYQFLGSKEGRVLRGGSWLNYPGDCRCAYRGRLDPDDLYYNIGFRVACAPPRLLAL